MNINKLIILFTVVSLNTVFAQNDVPQDSIQNSKMTNLELSKIQIIPIIDTNTERQYELYIKLPEGYSENNEINYPVLYFTDAMWHIEILSGSTEYLMENLILVGISWQKDERPEISRYRDYTILESMNPKYQSGDAHNHLTFIQNDIIKYIEDNYRTDTDNRTYFGYSLGGTFGAYVLLTQPQTFKNYILGSPETLLDDSYIFKNSSILTQNPKDVKANVFISNGELEKKELIAQAQGLVSTVKNLNDKELVIAYVTIESADHRKAFPMTALKSLYWLKEKLKQ
nr:alpha/beta hydrolase-fold protein [uncultured Allomuricauda sp.]